MTGNVQVSFVREISGAVTRLVFHQDGFDLEARKIR